MSYTMASGTVSSEGLVTTTEENQEFDFSPRLNNIIVKAGSSDITVKFNNETITHPISAGESISFSNFRVFKLTVVENSVEVQYTGTYL